MTEQLECVTDADAGPVRFPVGDDLGRSRGTDFYLTEEQLTDRERNLRDRVRRFCDTEVVPVAGEYWERAEFPAPLLRGYAGLGVAGAAIQGYGCAGISPVGEGFIVAEPARGDGSLANVAGFVVEHPRRGGRSRARLSRSRDRGEDRQPRRLAGAHRPRRGAGQGRRQAGPVGIIRRHQPGAGQVPPDRGLGGARTRGRGVRSGADLRAAARAVRPPAGAFPAGPGQAVPHARPTSPACSSSACARPSSRPRGGPAWSTPR